MRILLKLVLFPITLLLSILIAFMSFLLGVGGIFMSVFSGLCVLAAITAFMQGMNGMGLLMLILGFLFSRFGLRALGVNLIVALSSFNDTLKSI